MTESRSLRPPRRAFIWSLLSQPESSEKELCLRHLTEDEALFRLARYLNGAFMADSPLVHTVHAKGMGTLRQAVHELLAKHPLVRSYRLSGYGEGDSGITIKENA